jgi:hypothetical protein
MTIKSILSIICWALGGYVAVGVLSFFPVLLVARHTATDGFARDTAALTALVYAAYLGSIGLMIGCIVGAKRAGDRN